MPSKKNNKINRRKNNGSQLLCSSGSRTKRPVTAPEVTVNSNKDSTRRNDRRENSTPQLLCSGGGSRTKRPVTAPVVAMPNNQKKEPVKISLRDALQENARLRSEVRDLQNSLLRVTRSPKISTSGGWMTRMAKSNMKSSKIRRMEAENANLRTALTRTKRQLSLVQNSADKRNEFLNERIRALEQKVQDFQTTCESLDMQLKMYSDTKKTQRGRILFVSKERLASNESIGRHNTSAISRPQTAPIQGESTSLSLLPATTFSPVREANNKSENVEKEEQKAIVMPRIGQHNNNNNNNNNTRPSSRSRVIVVKTSSSQESKNEMTRRNKSTRNVKRIVLSKKPGSSSSSSKVDRLLKGMSNEMKKGIKKHEEAVAARRVSREKNVSKETKDNNNNERKKKKKVSVVIPGQNLLMQEDNNTRGTVSSLSEETTNTTKKTSTSGRGKTSPSPMRSTSPTQSSTFTNKSKARKNNTVQIKRQKKEMRAELEKEYKEKLREAKKNLAKTKVEQNLRISVVAPSVSLYFGKTRVKAKAPYPIEKARNLIRDKVLPSFTHIYELQNKKVKSPSGGDMELWLEDCVKGIYGSIETHLSGVLDLKRESKRVQFDW